MKLNIKLSVFMILFLSGVSALFANKVGRIIPCMALAIYDNPWGDFMMV